MKDSLFKQKYPTLKSRKDYFNQLALAYENKYFVVVETVGKEFQEHKFLIICCGQNDIVYDLFQAIRK